MPRFIVKHGDTYLVWSTIVDAPLTFACTLEEIRTFWRDEHGMPALMRLDQSLAAGGDEYQRIIPLAEVVPGNRAGFRETELTMDQIVAYYIIGRTASQPPTGTKR